MAIWKPGTHSNKYLPDNRKVTVAKGFSPKIKLYTVKEVAVLLRCSPQFIRKQIKLKRMSAVMYSGRYFINHLEISRWMGLIPRASAPFLRGASIGKRGKRRWDHAQTSKKAASMSEMQETSGESSLSSPEGETTDRVLLRKLSKRRKSKGDA